MTAELSKTYDIEKSMKFMTLIKPYSFENDNAEPPISINERIQNILSSQPTETRIQDDNSTTNLNSSSDPKQTIHNNVKIIEYLLFQLASQKANKLVLPIEEAKTKRNDYYNTFLKLMSGDDQIYTKSEAEKIATKIKDIYMNEIGINY